MTEHTFVILFGDEATPMLEAVMVSGMALQFPNCVFQSERSEDASHADMVIPVIYTRCNGGKHDEFITSLPPDHITADVQAAFSDFMREARAVRLH